MFWQVNISYFKMYFIKTSRTLKSDIMGRRPARCYRYCKNKPYPKVSIKNIYFHVVASNARSELFPIIIDVSLGSAVVSQTQRSVFTIWDQKRLLSLTSLTTSSWSPTSWNSFLPRLLRPLEFAPTNTWPRTLVKKPSISVCESTLSTSSESTRFVADKLQFIYRFISFYINLKNAT